LVEFHGAFYKPNSGAIYFALEYMEVGSLADIIRVKKFIPEPVLAHMLMKVLPVSIFYFQMLMFHLFTENSYELVIWYVL
jgi:serine/threonine protein kinase